MTVLEKKVKKIDYDGFIKMVEADEFKINEVDYGEMIDKKDYDTYFNKETKQKADRYNVSSVFNLFEKMCAEEGRIINIHEYLGEYMRLVKANFSWSYISDLSLEDRRVFENIMKLRGYSAYRSALAEISFKLLSQKIGNNEFNIHMTEDTDQILGVDIVLEHKEKDEAYYIHITKDSRFALDKLDRKSRKTFEIFNYDTQEVEMHERNFENHILALYDDKQKNNHIINGCYVFKEEYIKQLLEENKGLCNKAQFEELAHLDLLQNVEFE